TGGPPRPDTVANLGVERKSRSPLTRSAGGATPAPHRGPPDHPRRSAAAVDALRVSPRPSHSWATSENVPARAVCHSIQNANASTGSTRLVRVIHPFHPLTGQQLVCVGERCNRYGKRLL